MKAVDKTIWEIVSDIEDNLIDIRRDLHQYPELGFQEQRTAKMIADYLHQLKGVTVETGIGKTGVVGTLKCGKSEQTIALRADMDALAMDEVNDIPYKSKNKGCMHSCGHDGHVAILLGAASILSVFQDQLNVNVKFIFQPAEEGLGGARAMIKDNVLKKDNVAAIYGFHLNATADYGQVGVLEGPVMAGAARFTITIKGRGGHAAYPEKCVDPILVANAIYNAMQSVHLNIHASDACVISITAMNAGEKGKSIPNDAEMSGAIRYFDQNVYAAVEKRMRDIVEHTGNAFGARCQISFKQTSLPAYNDPAMCKVISKAADDLQLPVHKIVPSMGSDDYAYYLEHIPGAYMTFGIRKGDDFPVAHTNCFDFDDNILAIGAAQLAKCAILENSI